MKTLIFSMPKHNFSKKQIARIPDAIYTTDKSEALELIDDAQVLITFEADDEFYSKGKNLKWVHCLSAGVNMVLTSKLRDSNILLTNSSGVHAIPISEHIVGQMIALARQFNIAFKDQFNGNWVREFKPDELHGKSAYIVGTGEIGRATGKLLHAFGMKVYGYNRSKKDVDNIRFLDTDEGLKCDYVIGALPGTKETENFFDAEKLSLIKGFFINIGRGTSVDEGKLIELLESKSIRGASLDVFKQEPLPKNNKLWKLDNVIITAHYSGWTPNYIDRAIDIFLKNLNGYPDSMPTIVDKDLGY